MVFGLMAAVLSVCLQGADALGAPSGNLRQLFIWRTGFQTSYGNTALLAGAALLAGLAALSRRGTVARALSLLALLGLGGALATSGRASAAAPQWLTRPAVFLHGVAIAYWAGALLPLGFALASSHQEAGSALRLFSRSIPFALLPLVLALQTIE
jgi:copper transport protein